MKYFYTKHKKNNAFTLIELLTVIAIIGFISIIVYANLQDAKKRAQETKVVEEIDQLSKAFELYKTDNGVYPGEKEGGVLLEQSGGVNVISFLSDNLVNLKYIPIIPQYGDVSEYVPYTYYSGKSNVATRDGANIYCGDQKINDYIFIFKNENLNLILPKMSSRNDTISGYCIGQ